VKYWVAQLLGGILAALASWYLRGETFAPAPGIGVSSVQALLAEILFTFALVLVVLQTATSDVTKGNSYYGLAIGFTVLVGVAAAGDISGGALNPAVGLGPILVDSIAGNGSFADVWLYIVGPLAGGALAAIVFRLQGDS
jgi:aquaporin Z